jgi:hypothetical protein
MGEESRGVELETLEPAGKALGRRLHGDHRIRRIDKVPVPRPAEVTRSQRMLVVRRGVCRGGSRGVPYEAAQLVFLFLYLISSYGVSIIRCTRKELIVNQGMAHKQMRL